MQGRGPSRAEARGEWLGSSRIAAAVKVPSSATPRSEKSGCALAQSRIARHANRRDESTGIWRRHSPRSSSSAEPVLASSLQHPERPRCSVDGAVKPSWVVGCVDPRRGRRPADRPGPATANGREEEQASSRQPGTAPPARQERPWPRQPERRACEACEAPRQQVRARPSCLTCCGVTAGQGGPSAPPARLPHVLQVGGAFQAMACTRSVKLPILPVSQHKYGLESASCTFKPAIVRPSPRAGPLDSLGSRRPCAAPAARPPLFIA